MKKLLSFTLISLLIGCQSETKNIEIERLQEENQQLKSEISDFKKPHKEELIAPIAPMEYGIVIIGIKDYQMVPITNNIEDGLASKAIRKLFVTPILENMPISKNQTLRMLDKAENYVRKISSINSVEIMDRQYYTFETYEDASSYRTKMRSFTEIPESIVQ